MPLKVYQSLWATEQRRPGIPERPVSERFDKVKAAGFDGMAIDLGAMDIEAARTTVPEFARTGLGGLLTAFPRSIEELRPALHLAKDIGSPFVVVIGQVMPLAVAEMVPVIEAWMRIGREEGVPLQFETHRNCITNDMFATLLLLDAIPGMRLAADLSHYVVDREMMLPISDAYQAHVTRLLERSDSFQGRIGNRCQVQLPLHFPQHRPWIEVFRDWWRRGFALWQAQNPGDADCIFLCELGPRDYAITDVNGEELSDRWEEALLMRRWAGEEWDAALAAKTLTPGMARAV
ncbi:sugar phosphate isomerase/epimerase family protein [Ancylobacter defluvii]|uniref:Xylose isomerase n=1 Tax=Ancylobacter defluvii TaxID=1282440 RepID=A0A9W6K1I2_9HYPH|nr:sugar phosphate isomerase/epimerase [Ancylobacter defluvii]MBS7586492.1 sugar phosphate isomerase/epimerase [Ancylobacter defluvii]GLK85774.1 xylose isomerase [Ancylobacter defluvii]